MPKQFSDYPLTIPQVCLDLGFVDNSYSNDAAAAMLHPDHPDVCLWVAEERPEDREMETSRFVLCLPDVYEDLLKTESEDELRAFWPRWSALSKEVNADA